MQCDPRTGMEREVRQDSTVIRFWIDAYNRTTASLNNGRIAEPQLQAWWDGDSDRGAMAVGRVFGASVSGRESRFVAHGILYCRPDFSHTLGWWMVSKISNDGADRDKVIQLLSHPDSLASWYNAAVGQVDKSLVVSEEVW